METNSTSLLWDVFVSHSEYANGWVQQFAADAKRFDIRVFVDCDDVEPGQQIGTILSDGIRRSRDIVLAVNSLTVNPNKKWQAMEIAAALITQSQSQRIIPVLLDDTPLNSLNVFVESSKAVDLSRDTTRTDNYLRLLAFLKRRSDNDIPRVCVIRAKEDPEDVKVELLLEQLQIQFPGKRVFVFEVRPSGSSEIRLIADEEVADFLTRDFRRLKGFTATGAISLPPLAPLVISGLDFETNRRNEAAHESWQSPRSRQSMASILNPSLSRSALKQRADRAFQMLSPWDVFGNRRAIIGPRCDQLSEDAEEARRLLATGSTPSPKQLAALEQAIRLQRPAPACRRDEMTMLPDEGNWLQVVWPKFQPSLKDLQKGIARIDRVDDPNPQLNSGRTPLGTGFLVASNMLLTAAHVVDELSFSTGVLQPGQATVEFEGYLGIAGSDLCEISEVIDLDSELDLALLRLEPKSAVDEKLILQMSPVAVATGQAICVIGYPLEDPRNPSSFVSIIFANRFGVKRAAVGEVIGSQHSLFFHDCSTLGGNSGSPVIDISTAQVCGVHVSGRAMMRNEAVSGTVVKNFITRSLLPTSKSYRRINMNRPQRPSFDQFYLELQESDPELRAELETAENEMASSESTERSADPFTRETIVLTKGRPVLDIKAGATIVEFNEVESEIWKQRLTDANSLLAVNLPAVGRIELVNHPRGVPWLGTGWLIRDNIVVTNRHVAEVFGEADGHEFVFRPGFDDSPMRANIDFLEEFDSSGSQEFPLFKIMHIERGSGPDLAFLRIEPVNSHSLPQPVVISSDSAKVGDQVAVIGYPARDDFFPNPELMDRIFNHRYDKKRLAPGLIKGTGSGRVFHDCSTLGGNSGGEVVSLKTGHAVALHFAGTLFTKNHAVPIDVVAQRLDDVLAGRTHSAVAPARRDSEVLNLQSAPISSPRAIEATIPIKVRVEIGDVVIAGQSIAPVISPKRTPVIDLDADDDLIETTEARPEDYRDRKGYQPDFLGDDFEVPLPTLTENEDDILSFAFDGKQQQVLHYHHFSVVMSKSRRMCRYSACNIDGKQSKKTKRSGWQFDPRISKSAQIMKECYGNPPKFSRGHMTRREDPAWGSQSLADQGNRDSMHVTNTVPQIQPFNGGVWLALEDYALQNARKDDQRISVFTGPFLATNDPFRFDIKIPITFWKVIAFIHDETGELCATGYTMSQKSFIGEEEFIFGRHENNQRPIAEIERRAGISFGPLAELDPLNSEPESTSVGLFALNQIRFLR